MPRKNHSSDKARKRITRALEKVAAQLDDLERELHQLWRTRQNKRPADKSGNTRNN